MRMYLNVHIVNRKIFKAIILLYASGFSNVSGVTTGVGVGMSGRVGVWCWEYRRHSTNSTFYDGDPSKEKIYNKSFYNGDLGNLFWSWTCGFWSQV